MDTLIIRPDRNSHGMRDYTGAFKPESQRFAKAIPGRDTVLEIDVSRGMATRKKQLFTALDKFAEDGSEFDSVAFFMHGWPTGIQCGLRLNDAAALVEKLVGGPMPLVTGGMYADEVIVIPLYCCLTGHDPKAGRAAQKAEGPGGDGGFADRIRDELCKAGRPYCKVYAHTTKGHATRNPFVRTYVGDGSMIGGVDGQWVVPPPKRGRPSPHWGTWRKALWTKKGSVFDAKKMMKMKVTMEDLLPTMATGAKKPFKRDLRFLAPYMTSGQILNELAK